MPVLILSPVHHRLHLMKPPKLCFSSARMTMDRPCPGP
jgi:hypothetical protein